MAAAPPCQSPGQWEGQLACVITAGPAQRSAWPPYLRGPLLPPLLQKPPGSSPHPSSVSGRRADTLPGRGPLGAQRCAGHVCSGPTAIPSLGSSVPLLPGTPLAAPLHPTSILDQVGPETRGVHPRWSLSIRHSGIAPGLARRSSSPRGTKGPRIRPFPLGWGTVAFGYSGTKTPALWQVGGCHRGLHAGRLQYTCAIHMSEVLGSQDGSRGPRTEIPPKSLLGRVLPASSSSWGLQASVPGRGAAPLPSLPLSTSGRVLATGPCTSSRLLRTAAPWDMGTALSELDSVLPSSLALRESPASTRGQALRFQVDVQDLGGRKGDREADGRTRPTTSDPV